MYLFILICFWLHCIFVAVRRLSKPGCSGWGCPSLCCVGLSLPWDWELEGRWLWAHGLPLWQQPVDSVVEHGLSCSVACGIFPDQGWTHVPCISRWILNRWTTREIPCFSLNIHCFQPQVPSEPTDPWQYFLKCILLRYSWFAMLWEFLGCGSDSYIYVLFHILVCYGLPQDIGYSPLCYTVGYCCLSMLYIIVCIC